MLLLFFISLLSTRGSDFKAQGTGGISLAPSLIIMNASPGELKHFSVNISNNEEVDLSVDTHFSNIDNMSDSKINPNPSGEAGWLKILSDNLLLKSNQTTTLDFSLQVPAGAQPKGYFPVILFSFRLANSSGDIGVFSEIASTIYLNVGTEEKSFPQLDLDLKVTKQSLFGSRVNIQASILNSSNTFTQPKGRVVISDTKGNEFNEAVILNEENNFLLPGQVTSQNFDWKDEDNSLFPQIGKYKVRLELYQDGQEVSQIEYNEFLVIPYQYLLCILPVVLTVIFFGSRFFKGKSIKRKHVVRKLNFNLSDK